MSDIPQSLINRLDSAVVDALEDVANKGNVWDYINWLIAADLIGPDYIPENKQGRKKGEARVFSDAKKVYDAWVENDYPPVRKLAKKLDMSASSAYSRLTTYLSSRPSEKKLLSIMRGKDNIQREIYLNGYKESKGLGEG